MGVDYKLIDCLEKLKNRPHDEKIRLLYMWVKQGFIGLQLFKRLIESVNLRNNGRVNNETE